ncbi:SafA/ExsA family spore coat assembly protein [Bacillus alkalicola]|uniref:SafA/ExsA family spore coat assembly protein n=1 Tax=Bacillaceae TaxID=186817 RepID=UPI003AA8DEA8
MRIHIVQKGDTLWKIAQKYGVDFEALKGANTQLSNPDLIMPGMKIKVPTGSVQAAPSKKEAVKEQPVKEQPVKEQPKEMPKTPPPSIKEEKEAPIKMPAPPQPAPSYHTDIDLNIYQQQQKITTPPIMPKPKEQPKVKEKPTVEKPKVKKPEKIQPKTIKPSTKPMPMKEQVPEDCYPVPPFMPCPPPCPPGYQPTHHHGYPQSPYHGAMPAPAPMPSYGYGHGHGMPAHDHHKNVTEKEVHHQKKETPTFGDVTAHEFQNHGAAPYYPTGVAPTPHAGYAVPQFQGYGTYPYPYSYQQPQAPQQPYPYQGAVRDEEEDQ